MNGSSCSILIDQFSLFDKLYGLDYSFQTKLISSLKASGYVKLESEHFSFKEYFKSQTTDNPSLESFIVQHIPRISKLINCTFPFNTSNLVLKPINLEICDPKSEIINILKLF